MGNFISKIAVFLLLGLFSKQTSAQVTVSGANPLSNGPFPSLSSAFNAINTQIQTGYSITITITSDIIGDDASSPALNQGTWTSLTIIPSGARTFSTSLSWNLIGINGADNVTIDGLNSGGNSLTITNPNTSTGASTIKIYNDANNITIKNCTLLGSALGDAAAIQPTSNVSAGTIFIGTSISTLTTGNDNINIFNNNIGPASGGLPTCAIRGYNLNGSTTASNNSITISGNNIYDYFNAGTYSSSGIYVGQYNTGWAISNNKFYQTAARTITASKRHSAIFLDPESKPATNTFTISGNTFGYANSSGTGNYTITSLFPVDFIYVYTGISATSLTSIDNNIFTNIISVSTVANSFREDPDLPLKCIDIYSGNVNIGTTTKNSFGSQTATTISYSTTTNSSTSGVAGILIDLHNDCLVNINNNEFGGISASSSTGSARVYAIKGSPFANTISVPVAIQNNIIGGTVANSIQSTSTGTSSAAIGIFCPPTPCSIIGNTIRNLTAAGGTGAGSDPITSGALTSVIAIAAKTAKVYTISQNTISALSNTNTSAATIVTGIEFKDCLASSVVKRNMIRSLTVSNTAGVVNGINILNTASANFENNMIGLGKNEDMTDNVIGCVINGINETSTTTAGNNFYFNSIQIAGAPNSGANATYAFYSNKGSVTKNVRNNIFYNKRSNTGTSTGSHYAIRLLNNTSLTINYNDYQTTGTGGVLSRMSATNYSTLALWQGATTQDANSIPPFSPLFISDNDLHIQATGNTPLSAGIPISGITIDIDADTRSVTTPTIGADEIPLIILPIELIDFNGNCSNNNIVINWATATETNNDYFILEKSLNGINFTSIAKITGKGNSLETNLYQFVDEENNSKIVYYRLKQIDFNGQSTTSNNISITPCNNHNENVEFVIYPNPTTGDLTVSIDKNTQTEGNIEITNYLGQKILEQSFSSETNKISLSLNNQFASGIYFIVIKSNNEILFKQKVIKY